MNYILKLFIFSIFSTIIFFLYYFIFWHNEFNLSPINIFWLNFLIDKIFLKFIFWIFIIFWVYKLFSYKDEIIFTPLKLILYFLLFLLISCWAYFNFSSLNESYLLFSRIIYFSSLPILIFFITTWFWKKIINYLPNISSFSKNIKLLLSLNLWFFSFIFFLTIFSFFWFYNLFVVFFILIFYSLFSYKEIFLLFKNIYEKKFIFEKNDIKLLYSEIFLLISFFLFSVWLITIVRPFPVWWDDLWVYMNFPNILAYKSGLVSFSEMYSWQIFTWIWYLFSEPSFAFFLNFSWYFLSFLSLNLIFSDIFWNKDKKDNLFLPLPIILSTLFLSLPMSIFHSIKDIKLDQGLFFITTFIVYFLYKYLEKNYKSEKVSFIYIFIIWILAWFSFSIKFTSLFLIVWILSTLSFFFLWISWFFWFLFIFFSIFTAWNLWKIMNVAINQDFNLSIFTFLLWVFFLFFYNFFKTKRQKKYLELYLSRFKIYLKNIFLFLLWVFISLFPWFTKNIYNSYPNISIKSIIEWKSEKVSFDLEKIYTKSELKQKNIEKQESRKKDKITTNEDLRRYLWYESWILPYINMFWNLTMQTNQSWKFTEISFIFFAFIPLIFIFLPFFRKKIIYYIIPIFVFLQLIFLLKSTPIIEKNVFPKNISNSTIEKVFTKNKNSDYVFISDDFEKLKLSLNWLENREEIIKLWLENRWFFWKIVDFLASLKLPSWYFVLFILFIVPFLFLNYFLKNDKETFLFKINLVFSIIYIFLWCISSFWVVWYGITMYFCLLLMIWFWWYYISAYDQKDKELKFYWSFIFALVILSFLFFTSIPHSINNFTSVSYKDYKIWKKSYILDTFDLHSNYDKIFFELNIDDSKKEEFLKKYISFYEELKYTKDISQIVDFLKLKSSSWDKEAKKILEDILYSILYPWKYFQNNENIFRVWTFMKYYIFNNQKRIFEDWLLFYFNDYLNNKDYDKTWENLKKLWTKYLIIDLWTATIDDSETHWLTNRYEKLLKNLSSDNLKIIDTNSICIRFATDNEDIRKNDEKFFKMINWTYESYDENWKKIWRKSKLNYCIQEIENYVNSSDFESKKFPYLKKYIWKNFDEILKIFPKATYIVYKIK